ncbi:MAG: hypothetical protein ABR962_06690 [Candidatus Bathyarchaeia archaeon]
MKDVEFMLVSELVKNSQTSGGELAMQACGSQPTVSKIRSSHPTSVENLEEEWKR